MQTDPENALAPREEVAALPTYNAGITVAAARRISGRNVIAALASNENPYGASPRVSEALGSLVPSRYSDPACGALRQALSEKLGIVPDRIVCGNGSEDLISALCRAYLRKGDTVLTISPCFGLHEIEPMAAGAQLVKVPMTKEFDYDVDALAQKLALGPKIVFISSPSNPVGAALARRELARLVDAVPPGTLFVLDEAYFEMVGPGYPDGLKFLIERQGVSWVVLRTFSKAYGLAGLRVGYGVSSDRCIARAMRACLTPFNVNAAAQIAAAAALQDSDWMQETTAEMRRGRASLAERLRGLGVRVVPSQANFLFLDLETDAARVAGALLQKGIIVKPWMEPGYTDHLRVSVGKAEDNERFAQELARTLALA
ncbi:histidinol-phosphate transaminase [Mesorhizobium sp. ESP6-5]|uniref:histidinol-phosphate transaminase n=1 Tax=unclassified Mesorhizobium TaxID=325217 RepID=UPI00112A8784|nr:MULTISPECIES: histidinol-phosphate transaminase [unclassified Mesorhizobium]MBZ9683911.1 histidinol-phosphate transaminase [Mesorhizobium sp. CO1-1-2]MBZ9756971.1 histidinol-phosphate transaminase [Mesorhizobium sp. ESP6-5]TPK23976.1 histidinol-phosphate transaminase [Mesorhizobium sp. B2-5-9]TPK23995.1 histidinol-phosphate transaminase [Mesorhizobium sp. B2-5-9]